jgi:hypothetical protein
MTLQEQLTAAGLGLTDADFDRHGYKYPDLYVRAKPGVWNWLQANYRWPANCSHFLSDGEVWIDIPFAG